MFRRDDFFSFKREYYPDPDNLDGLPIVKGDAHYVGKWYGGNDSTEILSMGLDNMMHDPVGFYLADPEHFEFIIRFMRGDVMDITSKLNPRQLKEVRSWAKVADDTRTKIIAYLKSEGGLFDAI